MVRLRVVPGRGDPFYRTVEGESLIIGRSSDADLEIPDRFLSRQHARMFHRGDSWWVEDLHSRNGTRINGRLIERAERFGPGDELRLSASFVTLADSSNVETPSRRASSSADQRAVFRPAREVIQPGSLVPTPDPDSIDLLRKQSTRLQLINDINKALNQTKSVDELLELVLDRSYATLHPDEAAIFLERPDSGYYCAAHRSTSDYQSDDLFSETLLQEVAGKGMAALVSEATTDPRFEQADSVESAGVQSLVAAPLLDTSGSLGMIVLASHLHREYFDEDDVETLASLGAIAALRIRNISLAHEVADAIAEHRQLEEELLLAREIQIGLLPHRLPEIEGYELFARNVPCRCVSGDYYTVIQQPTVGTYALMVADVSGKGIAASLLASALEALAAGPIEVGHPPAEIFHRVSNRLFDRTLMSRFATAFIALLTPGSNLVTWASAGHSPTLLVKQDGTIRWLGATGPPLGLFRECSWSESVVQLDAGDLIVVYTDGIIEAGNREDEMFGTNRLADACKTHRGEKLPRLASQIELALTDFASGAPCEDDRTLVLLRRT